MQLLSSLAGVALAGLSLLPRGAVADKTAADYYVHSLPGAPASPYLKMHAGHIDVDSEHHGSLFFWHYQNRHIANRQRTVIWINGGPGCSSEDGALMEIGPYRVKDENTLELLEGSWDEFANLLFVDNPVGTGFSVVDSNGYVKELPDMADQFVSFLESWFKIFPEYEHDDLYIAGESYAGQHIPYIVKAILERNKKASSPWALKGQLIGNGWISPYEQYNAYLDFAYEKGLVERDSSIAKTIETQRAICNQALNEDGGRDLVDVNSCEEILQSILRWTQTKENGKTMCYNMYDVRLKDTYPSCGMNWPPDLTAVTPYLRRQDVMDALHVSEKRKVSWSECNGQVGGAFSARNSKPSISFLPELIEQVPTILFSGAEDLICNHVGTEQLISNMQWAGGKGFELSPGTWAPKQAWTFEGEPAGYYQEARNLTYILFYNSSHMVPFDYARRTRDMLDRFMGVDIASIGGTPASSIIDGEKQPATSVGGHPNSTAAEQAEQDKLEAAKWQAYYKSGEIVLIIVIIAVSIWGYYIWRQRRKMSGYAGLFNTARGHETRSRGVGLEGFRSKHESNDLEAGDFDESELDDLHRGTSLDQEEHERDGRYSVGSASDEEDVSKGKTTHS